MPRGRQTAQKASTLAFAEVLARGRIPRICFLDLQLQGRPRLDDLSRQLRGKIRARGGVSQKPNLSPQLAGQIVEPWAPRSVPPIAGKDSGSWRRLSKTASARATSGHYY